MLSRVANALYWLGRYLERAENGARFLTVSHSYSLDLRGVSHPAAECCWKVAAQLVDPGGSVEPGVRGLLPGLILDPKNPNSLLSSVTYARENARGIRDALASEMWEEINVLYLRMLQEVDAPHSETAHLSLLQRIRTSSHLFQGLRDNVMVQGDEWHFLRLGQFIERAGMTTAILGAMLAHPALAEAERAGHRIDTIHLVTTLQACTALEAFTRAEPALTLESVAGFLLLEARFPRAVAACAQQVGRSLHALSGTPEDVFSNDAEQLCGRLVAELRFASMEEIMDGGIAAYLRRTTSSLTQLGHAIAQLYFP